MTEHAMTVYKYGCPSWVDLPEEGIQQVQLAHDLRNMLVQIEREHADRVAAIWATHPEVANAKKLFDEAAKACGQVTAEVRAVRQRNRSTKPSPADKARLAQARAARQVAKTALRLAKGAALAAMRPQFAVSTQQRRTAIKATYADFVQERGLFWATYNDVRAHHETAVRRIAQQRQQGRPAELRFHRWTGEGTISVQLQRQAGDPPRTPALLASGEGKWRNVAQISPWTDPGAGRPRGKQRHGVLRFRLDTTPAYATVPVVLHRMMPADADVTDVRITRRRVGSHYRLTVTVSCRVPKPEPPAGGVVAVRLSWASMPGGWRRVAVVSSDVPFGVPPPDVAHLVRVTGGVTEIGYDPVWVDVLGRDASIRSHRDALLDALRPLVVEALRDDAVAEAVGVGAADVARWRAFGRFASLARRWPTGHPLWARLEGWRARDRHLWDYETNERDQVIARRRDAYRKLAEWLTRRAGTVVVHGLDLAEIRRAADVGSEDTEQARSSRAHMQQVAPGDFRAAVESVAARRGITIIRAEERKEARGGKKEDAA